MAAFGGVRPLLAEVKVRGESGSEGESESGWEWFAWFLIRGVSGMAETPSVMRMA
jgi:hypothetical protein